MLPSSFGPRAVRGCLMGLVGVFENIQKNRYPQAHIHLVLIGAYLH